MCLVLALSFSLTVPGFGAESAAFGPSKGITHPSEAQEQASGLWVVLGVEEAELLQQIAAKANGKPLSKV